MQKDPITDPAPAPQPPVAAPDDARRGVLPSSVLLQGGRSVEISHNGAVYRLQTTKLGKLILTK